MKMHAADDQGNSAAQDGLCFERARAERGEDSAVTVDRIADRLRIEQVPLNDAQSIARHECLPIAHKRGDRMAEIERTDNQPPANTSSSTKDDDLHETFRGLKPARPLYRAILCVASKAEVTLHMSWFRWNPRGRDRAAMVLHLTK